MRATMTIAMAFLIAVMSHFGLVACGASAPVASAPPPQAEQTRSQAQPAAESLVESAGSGGADSDYSSPAGQGASYASRRRAEASPTDVDRVDEAQRPDDEAQDSPRGQQLIYTGAIVLAIYEVEETQQQAIEVVENLDGYVAERSSTQLTARVPANAFRQALQQLSALGDVLDTRWKAQDVTEKMRDLDIRLRNSKQLRDRLEALLEEAETIEDALAIEAELERVTLEIERIRGTLLNMQDRIAYSTIEVRFDTIEIDSVPDDEFLLPFAWLHNLGLESLLLAPEAHR